MKTHKRLYFAYGSNMSQHRLEKRVGKVKRINVWGIKGYSLVFNAGYEYVDEDYPGGIFANLIKTGLDEHVVYGVVYELSDKQLRLLDGFEGAPLYYNRVIERYQMQPIIIYVSINQNYRVLGEPSVDYLKYIVEGYVENKMNGSLQKLKWMYPLIVNRILNEK